MNQDLKTYFKYAFTTLCSFIVFRFSDVLDTIFAGKFIGADGLKVMSLIFPFCYVVNATMCMITTGSTVIVGKYIGEDNYAKANKIFAVSFSVLMISTIIYFILGMFFSKQIIFFLGGDENILKDCQTYLLVYLLFSIFRAVEHFMSAFVRLTNRPTIIPFFSLANTLLNLFFKYLFMAKWTMGVFGLAFSSFIAIFIVAIVYLFVFFIDKSRKLKFQINSSKDFKEIFRIMYNGLADFTFCIFTAIVLFITNQTLIKYSTADAIASYNIYDLLVYINLTFITAFSSATTPLISINLGKKEFQKIRKFLSYCFCSCLITGLIIFVISAVNPMLILNCFLKKDKSQQVIDLALKIISVGKYNFILATLVKEIFINYLSAIQKATESLILSVIGSFIIPVIAIITCSSLFGINGFIWSQVLSTHISVVVVVGVVYVGRNKYMLINKTIKG